MAVYGKVAGDPQAKPRDQSASHLAQDAFSKDEAINTSLPRSPEPCFFFSLLCDPIH
jgi:hypothetical protein